MRKKTVDKKNYKHVNLIIFLVCLFAGLITFGYSAFQSGMDIENLSAMVRLHKDIRISGATVSSFSNNGNYSYVDYDVKKLYTNIELPYENSTVTYAIEVTNLGNVEMGIHNILGLPDNLTYSYDDYITDATLCDDHDNTVCKLGSVSTVHITIGYATNGYDSSLVDKTFALNLEFKIQSVTATARIGNSYYNTLAEAISHVTTSDPTTIMLIRDTGEELSISSTQNITLDLDEYVLSSINDKPVIENKGNLTLIRGTIETDATQGAINNRSGASFTMSGGSIISTGTKQAIYNEGTATISGGAYLSNTSSNRAVVQNQANSTLYVRGGTLISNDYYGIENKGTLVIGTDDGTASRTSPSIRGDEYGIYSTVNFSYYDGIIRSKNDIFNVESRANPIAANHGFLYSVENINGDAYRTVILASNVTVTFNPNGGSVSETERTVAAGSIIGIMPAPTRTNYVFQGWFDADGNEISGDDVVYDDLECIAHWIHNNDVVTAMIGQTEYSTLQAAVTAAPNNTQTTIVLMKNATEAVVVPATKNIILDLNSYTLSNYGNNKVIENNGTLQLGNGTIYSNVNYSAIDNNRGGHLIVNSGIIRATGTRQAIYNVANATVEISGSAYLTAAATGKPSNSTMERGTVQNLSGGTVIITGGTIIGNNQQAVSNEGTLRIGTSDGTVDLTAPTIQGKTCGLKTTVAFEFYDGKIKGVNNPPINGITPTIPLGYSLTTTTENISGTNYYVTYLN